MDEAMKEAVRRGDEEFIPASRSDKDLQDEMNERSCKAGLTNRQGECSRASGRIMTSVAFGVVKHNVWPRDEHGNLI